MGVSYKNPEGYHDPVPCQAISHIEKEQKKYMPIIYICSPYSGDTVGNTIRARTYSRFAVNKGYIPVAPHLLFPQFMDEDTERELAMFMDAALLSHCTELWVFGSNITAGMEAEINKAKKKQMPIHYFNEDLQEVIR